MSSIPEMFQPNHAAIDWARRHGLDPETILPELEVTRMVPGSTGDFRVAYTQVEPDGSRETRILYTDEKPPPTRLFPRSPDWRARAEAAEAKVARVERALADELENLADDGARLSHSVVRRIEAALAGEA